jgi:anaerobic magnesium-protoporphyrin IX monomethyl ester cyclase
LALCAALRRAKLGLSWFCSTRIDHLSLPLPREMAAAGCKGVALGIETASHALLADQGKELFGSAHATRDARHLRQCLVEALEAARTNGILTLGYFILGLPQERLADLVRTVHLACTLPLDHAYFHCLTPFPGTPLFDTCVTEGYLTTNDWQRFDEAGMPVLSTDHLQPEQVYVMRRLAQALFYCRPSVLGRELARTASLADLRSKLRSGLRLLFS